MSDILDQIFDEIRSAWRFRWAGLVAALLLAIAGWAYVLSMPDRYEASASVFVDTQTALKPVLQGLIVENDVMSQLGYVRQSMLSGPTLEAMAVEAGVLPPGTVGASRDAILAAFASKIGIKAEQARADAYSSSGTVYSVSYPDTDPARAVAVTTTVMDTFIRETLGGKQASADHTQSFLAEQIASYEKRLREQESKLAQFKRDNLGLMPTDRGDYFSQLEGEMAAARQAQNELDLELAARAELARQLRGESVIGSSTIANASAGGTGTDTTSRIRETQARLDELLLRFTERHPEVLEISNQLEELKARREQELESLRRGDTGAAAATGLSSNPVYQSIQLQLNQADVKIASLRGRITQHNAKIGELRKLLDSAPNVDVEYSQLNRDYDIIKQNHALLVANYEKAMLSEQADNAGGVRFDIVQAPAARLASASAHRHLLLAGVLGAALAAGAGLAYLLTLIRPVVTSVRDLTALTELPVLGVVSSAFPTQLHSQARATGLWFGAAASLLLVGFVTVLLLNRSGFRLTTALIAGAG